LSTAATIRRATIDDADTVSSLGARTFSDTFAHLYPTEDLETFLAYAYGLERTRRDLADPDKATWLLELDDEAIGYATAGPCGLPHPDVKPERRRAAPDLCAEGLPGRRARRAAAEDRAGLAGEGRTAPAVDRGVVRELRGAEALWPQGVREGRRIRFPVGETRDLEFILRRG
jgi:hypothetical protein